MGINRCPRVGQSRRIDVNTPFGGVMNCPDSSASWLEPPTGAFFKRRWQRALPAKHRQVDIAPYIDVTSEGLNPVISSNVRLTIAAEVESSEGEALFENLTVLPLTEN